MSKDAYYFSHDSNARNDEKLVMLRMKYDWKGYGIYWAIVERLRECKEYMSLKDYNLIAFELRVDASIIKSIIEEFGLFVFTDCGEYFYSESLKRRMLKKEERSEIARNNANKRWGNDANNADSMQLHSKPNAIKEKKVKESKGKENIYSAYAFFRDEFKAIWLDEFIPLKKRKKASTSDRSFKTGLNKIEQLSGGNYEIALEILKESVDSGWTKFYPLKQQGGKNGTYEKQTSISDAENFIDR